MPYQVGSAFVQIVPSFSGIVDQITAQATKWGSTAGKAFSDTFIETVKSKTNNAPLGPSDPKSSDQGSKSAGKFADGFKAKLTAALKDLPNAKIDADSTDADRKIADIRAELTTLRDAKIGVDISDADALAKVEFLKAELVTLGAKSETIPVKVDTAAAAGELTALTAAAGGAGAGFEDLDVGAADAGGGLDSFGASAASAVPAVGALGPAVVALVAAIGPLAGLAAGGLATLPAIFAGALSGVAALKIGLSGIGGAISAFQKQSSATTTGTGASTAISDAASIRNAANSVVSSQEAVATAQTEAADQVHSAQESLQASNQQLATSERDEANAQQAVIAARQQAQRQLEDYTNQLADAALSQRQAQLDLVSAQQNQATVDSTPGSTALSQQQAQLAVDQAKQQITDLATSTQQLQQDAAAAATAGVSGNQQVIASEQQLSDAQLGVATAQQSQADAQHALTEAQQQGVQRVADANRALQQALAAQSDALAEVSAKQGGAATSADSFATAMAGLTPAGRAFVNVVTQQLIPQYDAFKSTVQAALLPGLTTALQDMLPVFQDLGPFIVGAAQGIGAFASNIAGILSSQQGLSDLNGIFSAGAGFMQTMGQAAGVLLQAFLTIGSQAQPIVKALGDGILGIVQAFGKWVANGGFEKFLNWLKANGPGLVKDLEAMVKAFVRILINLAPFGVLLLKIVGWLATFAAWLTKSPALLGGLTVAVGILGIALAVALDTNPIGLFITAISFLAFGIIELVANWSKVWAEIKSIFDDAVSFLRSGFGTLVLLITGPFAPLLLLALHWQQVWDGMQAAASAVWGFLDGDIFQPLVTFFTVTLPGALDTAVGFFTSLPGKIRSALSSVWGDITGAFGNVASWVTNNVIDPIVNLFKGLPGDIINAISGVGTALGNLGKDIANAIIGGINDGINDINSHIPSVFGQRIFPSLPDIPKFHSGGVVPGAPGTEQLALLQAGERVFTPAQMQALSAAQPASGVRTAPLVGQLNISALDVNEAATQLEQRLTFTAITRGW